MLSNFSSSIGSSLKSVTALGAGLTGIGAAVKGMMEVGQAFQDIDRIAKSAQSFGLTTEEMVGLEHAAELSGVSAEELAKAMQKATREGLNLADVADQMRAIEDPSERAAFAFKTLGKNGQTLIPLLSAGGDELRKMMEEGNRLAGFSGLDAAKVEEANDAITRMQLAFTGVARDLAITLAPAVDAIAQSVQGLGESARSWMKGFVDNVQTGIRHAGDIWDLGITNLAMGLVDFGAMVAPTLIGIWDGAGAAFSEFSKTVIAGFTEIGNVAQALGQGVVAALDAAFSGSNPLEAFQQKFTETFANQKNAVGGGNPLDAFMEAFTKSKANTSGLFSDMQAGLLEDQQRILAGAMDSERAFLEQQNAEAVAVAPPTFLASDGSGEGVDKAKKLGGAERGSKEALERIVKAGLRNKDPGVKVVEKQLASSKAIEGFMQKLAANPPAVVVGTI